MVAGLAGRLACAGAPPSAQAVSSAAQVAGVTGRLALGGPSFGKDGVIGSAGI
jgi:hypothetical protein